MSIIRIPRERMIGYLRDRFLPGARDRASGGGPARPGRVAAPRASAGPARRCADQRSELAWQLWERWISEIIADLYAIARVGVASTMGLIGLVSLPSAFVFRIALDDPHPSAWIRVHLSCAFGDALYPDPQWRQLARVWTSLYPVGRLLADRVRVIRALLATAPAFVRLVLGHRPAGAAWACPSARSSARPTAHPGPAGPPVPGLDGRPSRRSAEDPSGARVRGGRAGHGPGAC